MREVDQAQPIYFPVSLTKLFVLSVCTLGLYELYWFFKNWQLVAVRTGAGRYVTPAIQVVLAFFFCFPFFKRVAEVSREVDAPLRRPGWLAISWVLLHLAGRIQGPFWIISLGSVVPLLVVQTSVNEINSAFSPTAWRNSRFSVWNVLTCVLGAAVLIFALVNTFAPQLLGDPAANTRRSDATAAGLRGLPRHQTTRGRCGPTPG